MIVILSDKPIFMHFHTYAVAIKYWRGGAPWCAWFSICASWKWKCVSCVILHHPPVWCCILFMHCSSSCIMNHCVFNTDAPLPVMVLQIKSGLRGVQPCLIKLHQWPWWKKKCHYFVLLTLTIHGRTGLHVPKCIFCMFNYDYQSWTLI